MKPKILNWYHESEISDWPDAMKEATAEQLNEIEIIRDEKGIIIGAKTKTADITSIEKE